MPSRKYVGPSDDAARPSSSGTPQNDPGGTGQRNGRHRLRPLLPIVAVPMLVAVILTLFALPAARMAPHELPLGLAGPEPATRLIEQRLTEAAGEDAFDVHRYADRDEARAAIEKREVYGALVVERSGPTVLVASAASPTVAELLRRTAARQAGDATVPVVDVVPTDPDDPRGAVLSSSVLPLVLSGLAGGMLLWLTGRPGLGQVFATLLLAGLAGLVVVGIAQGWLGALGGDWRLNAGVLGLTVAAIAATVAGAGAVLGRVGVGLAAAVMMLIGNPFSGISSAPELLPAWAGVTGRYLPPGAGGTLLRSVAYFDGAAATTPLLVLTCWTVVGLLLILFGRRTSR